MVHDRIIPTERFAALIEARTDSPARPDVPRHRPDDARSEDAAAGNPPGVVAELQVDVGRGVPPVLHDGRRATNDVLSSTARCRQVLGSIPRHPVCRSRRVAPAHCSRWRSFLVRSAVICGRR